MKKLFTLIILSLFITPELSSRAPDILTVKGDNTFEITLLAIEKMGGMQRFVKEGQTVGILVNSGFREKGAYVDPDVVIAAIKTVFEAGADSIVFIQHIDDEYWERSELYEEYKDLIKKAGTVEANKFPAVFNEEFFVKYPEIEGAKAINWELEIVKDFFEVDVFINIPIAKHHSLTTLTNAMKNLMGINTRASNVKFHLDGPSRNDPVFLAQSIVDLNLIRKADLIISDMTHVITTNGPGGPGEIVSPLKVVVSTDPVAIDAFCAQEIGFFIDDVLTISLGHEAGLGKIDLEQINIVEIEN